MPSLVQLNELVVWGQLQTTVHFGELHLVSQIVAMAIYSRVWTIRWWLVVEGASRHPCNTDRSVYSSKGVESRSIQQNVWKWRIEDLGANTGYGYEML